MKSKLFGLVALAALFAGCGNTNHPLDMFGDPNANPNLNLPLSNNEISSMVAYTTATPAFQLLSTFQNGTVLSPGVGLVTNVESQSTGFVVTVYHSPRVISQVSRLSTSTVRAGDQVGAGSVIGVTNLGQFIYFSVFYNAEVTCPLSFLSSDARTQVFARLAGPCAP